MNTLGDKKVAKTSQNFYCQKCDYITCKINNYKKHVLTDKHNVSKAGDTGDKIGDAQSSQIFPCDNCNKKYMSRNGLWKHKKKCNNEITMMNNETNYIIDTKSSTYENDTTNNKDQMIMMLIKQNSELIKETSDFKNMMMEVVKNGTHNTNTNTNNSHNKTFNLQFFLNETCKDAMNIMDFVDSIKLQLSDLENVGKLGYVEGISNIITKNLKNLDVQKRPIHCTDSKREVLYVKDEGKWYNDSKEEENKNKKIRKVIKHIAYKNTKLLTDFKAKHPDCIYSDSKKSDQYNKIILEAFGGSNEDLESENKIIKKIVKEVTIEKE